MLSYTARAPPELGLSLDQSLASHHPPFTLQSEKAAYCALLDWDLSQKFREEFSLRRGTGQGWPRVIFSSLTAGESLQAQGKVSRLEVSWLHRERRVEAYRWDINSLCQHDCNI